MYTIICIRQQSRTLSAKFDIYFYLFQGFYDHVILHAIYCLPAYLRRLLCRLYDIPIQLYKQRLQNA